MQRAECNLKAVVPRTDIQRQDGDEQVQFYPLPPELNQAVLASLGVGGSKQVEHPNGVAIPGRANQGYDGSSSHFNSGLFQPEVPGAQGLPMQRSHSNGASVTGESMEEEGHTPGQASTSHGPHCKSIPQLSVRHYGGTASQLWALCPDCGAFSKVHEDKPVVLCYSP